MANKPKPNPFAKNPAKCDPPKQAASPKTPAEPKMNSGMKGGYGNKKKK